MPLLGANKVNEAIIKTVQKRNKEVRKIFIQGLSNIAIGTPVDEGRARANWQLTTDVPGTDISNSTSQLKGLSEVNTMPKQVFNKHIFYTNNLPYIETLEYGLYPNPRKTEPTAGELPKTVDGYSTQARGGWVRTGLERILQEVREL